MPAVSSFIIPSFWYIAFGTYNFLLYFEDKIWEEEEKIIICWWILLPVGLGWLQVNDA